MSEEPTEARQMRRQHIFCVNGYAEFLDFVRVLFQQEDYNVTTTNFVPNTFAQIEALQPSVLIIDLEVGRRAGFELLEHLQAEASTRDIPVMVVSTDRDLLEEARIDPTRYGGQVFLAKPFDIDDLLNAVREMIGTA